MLVTIPGATGGALAARVFERWMTHVFRNELKIKLEREHMEAVGREFVDSYVDVLPIHPNLRMIEKYNPNYV